MNQPGIINSQNFVNAPPKKGELLSAYWTNRLFGQDDLSFWGKGRTGMVIPDTIGNDDINILTPTFKGVANYLEGDKTRAAEKILDGNSYTIYFQSNQLDDYAGGEYPLRCGNTMATTQRGMCLYVLSGALVAVIQDESTRYYPTLVSNIATGLRNKGWVEFFIRIDFAAKLFKVNAYDSDGNAVGSVVSQDISTLVFNNNNNYANFYFGNAKTATCNFKKYLGLKTIEQCRLDSYVTDLQMWYPEILSGTDVTGNGNHLTIANLGYNHLMKHYSNKLSYLLDYGYSVYSRKNYADIDVPNTPAGTAIARTLTGWALTKVVAGNLTGHNGYDSYLEFTGESSANLDQSDANIFNSNPQLTRYENAANRAFTYYVAATPKRRHISLLNRPVIENDYTDNHKGLVFTKAIDNTLEVFGYQNNKTGSDLTKVLYYTRDSNPIQLTAVISSIHSVTIRLKGIIGRSIVKIIWGDGTVEEMYMDGTLETITHWYVADGTYPVSITNPASLIEIDLNPLATQGLSGVAEEFNKAVNLEKITLTGSGVKTGSVSGWSAKMKEITIRDADKVEGGIALSGSVGHMMNIEVLYLFGECTIDCPLADKVKLTHIYLAGYCTSGSDLTNCVNLVFLETSMASTGHRVIISATVTEWTKLQQICTDGDIYGSFDGCTGLKYISCGSNLTNATCNVTNKTSLYLINGGAGIVYSGSLANLSKLQIYGVTNSVIEKPVRLNNHPKISSFTPNPSWIWTSAEVNQLLADVWANKDDNKTDTDGFTTPYRSIGFNTVGSGAPTGQGLTDLAALRAYRSPNNDGAYALWTIDVNS